MTAERPEPSLTGSERDTLGAFLDFHRATLAWKCDGVPPDRLRERTVPPSTLSLLGLVRHLTDVERGWFRVCLAGEDVVPYYWSADDRDGDFDNVDHADVADAFARWEAECESSRRIVASFGSLDDLASEVDKEPVTVRWVLVHLIEEYARHNGHADLLRERIDGQTGE